MKKTSEEVRDHLLTVEDKLGSLKHRQLLGFQTDVHSTEKQRYLVKIMFENNSLVFCFFL